MGKMKKWVFILISITLLIFAGFFYGKKLSPKPKPNKVLSAIEAPKATPVVWKQSIIVNIDNVPIRISWTEVKPKEVELYSNLKEQKLSEEIKVNKSCQILVSGGFYSKENTHLGLFVSNFETISKFSQNALLNGFLSIDSADKITIGMDAPSTTARLGLQSGPLLALNKKPLSLVINNDEPSRRIVAATTNNNQLIFLVFYRDQSDLQGPLLGQLPKIIALFEKQTDIDIVDAINLDGGSHSVFISNYDLLRESAIAGSYFCIK